MSKKTMNAFGDRQFTTEVARRFKDAMDKIDRDHEAWVAREERRDRIMFWLFAGLFAFGIFMLVILPSIIFMIRRLP